MTTIHFLSLSLFLTQELENEQNKLLNQNKNYYKFRVGHVFSSRFTIKSCFF
jgi:hypothetical protein